MTDGGLEVDLLLCWDVENYATVFVLITDLLKEYYSVSL